ncbi:MAG: leucine-rich repeat domain-containing protein, partial [Clostridia bacterium]|nr:leucine-rich repeat domain-containing protein [Clostridia bacterium]
METIGSSAFVSSSLKSIAIPDGVTEIGGGAFAENYSLSSVTLGKGLTEINNSTFDYCTALTEILIPKGIQSIGGNAFAFCRLTKVLFEEDSVLKTIGEGAFFNCRIREIDIPPSVTVLDSGAFSNTPLVSVSFGEDSELRMIGSGTFSSCLRLKTIELPGKLEIIGGQAFMGSGLVAVCVPASVKTLGYGVFACCSQLTSIEIEEGNTVYHDLDGVVYTLDNRVIHSFPAGRAVDVYTLEQTVRTITPWAFAGTSRLGTVVLPEALTVIGEYGFYLAGINRITLPESLVEIQQYAFAECTALQSVHIPDNVLQIGRYAFAQDWALH